MRSSLIAQLLYWLTKLVQDKKVPVWVKTVWRLIRIFILTSHLQIGAVATRNTWVRKGVRFTKDIPSGKNA